MEGTVESFMEKEGIRLVSNVTNIVLPGTYPLVMCDIDDTLISSSVHKIELAHPEAATWCHQAREKSIFVYLTARNLTLSKITRTQLEGLGLPVAPIFFDIEKGKRAKTICALYRAQYDEIVFIDDQPYNVYSVKKALPRAHCFLVRR